jgi:predicted LPLAT superfamily acyltransferase
VLKLPLSLAVGLYSGGNPDDQGVETLEDPRRDQPRAPRATRMAALIQRYAGRLEHYARLAPYNWFNFYDFWNSNEQPQPASEVAADAAVGADAGRRGDGLGGAAGG